MCVFVDGTEGSLSYRLSSSWPDRYLRALALDAPRRRGALALRRRLGVGLDVDVLLALVVGLDLDDVVVPRHRVEGDASEMRDGVAVDEHAAAVPRLDADDAELLLLSRNT